MNQAKGWVLFVVTLALLLGSAALLVSVALRRIEDSAAETVPGESLYREVMERVSREHVDPVDAERAVYGAMKGLVSELDPHSRAFDPAEWAEFERESRGESTGVGIEVAELGDDLIVATVAAGSPAAAAGVRPEERLVAVAGRRLKTDREGALEALQGPKGTRIRLTLDGGAAGGPEREVEVVRDTFEVATVSARLLAPDVVYARIDAFRPKTGEAFERAVRPLLAKAPKGLVLDLRFNRGGAFEAAVAVADAWMASGPIVRTRGPAEDQVRHATPEAPLAGVPTVILVNGSTASAAEVVAGALQDTHMALLVGERTFGKGVIQELIEFESWPGGMKLTTARTFSPAGRCIDRGIVRGQAAGLLPDFVVEAPDWPERDEGGLEAALDREQWPERVRARWTQLNVPTPADVQLAAAIALIERSPRDLLVKAPDGAVSSRPR